jgi:hypothetical protein
MCGGDGEEGTTVLPYRKYTALLVPQNRTNRSHAMGRSRGGTGHAPGRHPGIRIIGVPILLRSLGFKITLSPPGHGRRLVLESPEKSWKKKIQKVKKTGELPTPIIPCSFFAYLVINQQPVQMPKMRSPQYAFRPRKICVFRGPHFRHLNWLLVDDKVCKKRTRYDGVRELREL